MNDAVSGETGIRWLPAGRGEISASGGQLGVLRGFESLPLRFAEQSVAVLDGSGIQLELARTLTALGSAIRHAGRRTESREPLRRGLGLAEQCGSTVLAERAREELRLAGARPRRAAISGPASLTPSERRIAERAAAGKTNRQIAQELFLTMKTVAFHLTNAYRKLDVSSREELAAVLSGSN